MTSRSLILGLLLLTGGSVPALAQPVRSPCGHAVTVRRADTLSSIAERCDVDEADILRANPGIKGSADLVAGSQVQLPTPSSGSAGPAERLGSAAREAGDALAGFAKDLGASVDDLLKKNPDLHQRLRQLGEGLDIPGIDASRAQVSVSPDSGPVGSTVTLSAVGLPRNAPVRIGGGAPRSAYDVIDTARTGSDGTLQVNIQVPASAGNADRIVFTIAGAKDGWQVHSSPFRVTGTKL